MVTYLMIYTMKLEEPDRDNAEEIEIPTLFKICPEVNAKADLKQGIKLPKFHGQWSVANDFFKATFLNSPISAQNLNTAIKK